MDGSPADDVERVWIRAEHTVASFGQGLLTTGDFEAPGLWNVLSPVEQSHEGFRRTLGMGNDGVTGLRRLAAVYLGANSTQTQTRFPTEKITRK